MDDSLLKALNISPDVADRLRKHRPGYERIAALVADFDQITGSKKASTLAPEDVADMFVRPALETLGWEVQFVDGSPFQHFQDELFPLVAGYRGLQMAVGVHAIGRFSNERNTDTELQRWAEQAKIKYGLLTNFENNRFWVFDGPQALARGPVLEVNLRDYLTNDSSKFVRLAAEKFYQALDLEKAEPSPPEQQDLSEPAEIDFAQSNISESEAPPIVSEAPFISEEPEEEENGEPDTPSPSAEPPDFGPYSQPGGPGQRYDELMPGIAFSATNEHNYIGTITALVTNQNSGVMQLLLPGLRMAKGMLITQPALSDGADLEINEIGAVDRVERSETAIAALVMVSGDRSFVSTLPNEKAVAGATAPEEGLNICKFGAETGYTQGKIDHIQVDSLLRHTRTEYQSSFIIEDPDFAASGDVGALVLTLDDNRAAGVIIDASEGQTVCLPIKPVLEQLNVQLITEPVRFVRRRTTSDDLTAANDLIGGEDRLGFSHYVDAFARLIRDKNTQPPLTIGVYGAWGTGKSFLMDKIANAIGDNLGDPEDRRRWWQRIKPTNRLLHADTLVVRFEAWDYNGSDKLWAGLVEQIFGTIEKEMGWYGQLRFNLKRNLLRQWKKLESRLLPYTLIAIVIGIFSVGFVWSYTDNLARIISGGLSSVIAFLLMVAPQIVSLFSTSASRRVVDMFATGDYKEDIGFMGRIRGDLEDFVGNLPPQTKVVIFIDDLDRCDPRKAVEVLEATKLLLELDRFIVFLALDARIITQAVEEHYGRVLSEAEITGYEYLDKIVQIPFSIPEPRPADLRNYLGSLMGMQPGNIPPLPQPSPPAPKFLREEIEPGEIDGEAEDDDEVLEPGDNQIGDNFNQEDTGEWLGGFGKILPAAPGTPPPIEERAFDTVEVPFTPEERQAFLGLHPFLDPNPRRLKRMVNIYRLVRVLIKNQQSETGSSTPDLLKNASHTLAWLVLCEQWPYATHTMLDEMDQRFKATEPNSPERQAVLQQTLAELNEAAQSRIAQEEENEALQKLDLKYERLEKFIEQHLQDFAVVDLRRLRPFTVNFNPALSAEVRLTLAHH